MQDTYIYEQPQALDSIIKDTIDLGFDMASEPKTGAFLKSLAASKPNGSFLELGTGTGLSAAWILLGMNQKSTLLTIDNDLKAQEVAEKNLGYDSRIKFLCTDAELWLDKQENKYDFIFADAWAGKFSKLEESLNLLAEGGMYIIDDLLPQSNWPEGHTPRVPTLLSEIEKKPNFTSVRMEWASGLMVVTRK